MIDTQAIRINLLDAAIHGNLTENNDYPSAETILSSIEEQYSALLSSCDTKEIVDVPMINEGLFELPNTWVWVPLCKLCVFLSRGKSPKYSEVKKYPVFAQKCNQPAGLALDRALFLDETTLDKWQQFFRLQDGDILINSTGTGTMGRIGYYESAKLKPEYPFMVPDSHVTVARLGVGVVPKYIYYAMRSSFLQKAMEKQFRGTTNQKEFYINSVAATPIPLPPTKTQELIVATLDSSYAILRSIDEKQVHYSNNLAALRNKLIDAAIQGKLTEQVAEDDTAEELYQKIQVEKLALIKSGKIKKEKTPVVVTDTEKPFEIPENWKWVSVGDVCINIQYGSSKKSSPSGKIPVIRMGNIQKGKIVFDKLVYTSDDDEIARYPLETGDLLFNRTNSMELVGKTGIYKGEQPAIYAGYLVRVTPLLLLPDYLNYCMQSKYYWDYCRTVRIDSNGQSNINAEKLKRFVFPLPPLAEQRRIVSLLDQVLERIAS